ncbi:hypothetical protein EYF80_027108 [Liparis tanakae]|uniref:Uncharacterized protein n=1 Tax=Liparis tanakae TaxID=230148 RepID=A0A4Z2H9V1_9TELE|nr:hypothetical protein EYF80_027108 [Liparis tanakae]
MATGRAAQQAFESHISKPRRRFRTQLCHIYRATQIKHYDQLLYRVGCKRKAEGMQRWAALIYRNPFGRNNTAVSQAALRLTCTLQKVEGNYLNIRKSEARVPRLILNSKDTEIASLQWIKVLSSVVTCHHRPVASLSLRPPDSRYRLRAEQSGVTGCFHAARKLWSVLWSVPGTTQPKITGHISTFICVPEQAQTLPQLLGHSQAQIEL